MKLNRTIRRGAIPLTPLIDVVFILLIFFMLVTSFVRERAIGLDTTSSSGAASSEVASYVLRVSPEWLELSGERHTPESLGAALAALDARDEPARVTVQPVNGASVQQVVSALDLLDDAGMDSISLGTSGAR